MTCLASPKAPRDARTEAQARVAPASTAVPSQRCGPALAGAEVAWEGGERKRLRLRSAVSLW
jgi:hypothetical protein